MSCSLKTLITKLITPAKRNTKDQMPEVLSDAHMNKKQNSDRFLALILFCVGHCGSVCDLQVRGRGFDPRLGWIMLWCCAPRRGTLPTHALSWPRSTVSGYLVGQWRLVCLNSSGHWKWQPGCMLPRSWGSLWMNRSCDQGVIVWSWVSGASH